METSRGKVMGESALEAVLELAPTALLALGVLIAGLILTVLLGKAVRWLVQRTGLEALAERMGVAKVLYAIGIHFGLAELLRRLAMGGSLLATFAVLAEVLGLPGVAEGVAVLLEFLPRLVSAGLVLLGGLVGADLLSRLVLGLGSTRPELERPEFLSRVVYYTVVVVASAMAAEQLGLEVGLVSDLILIAGAAAAFGAALSLALGSRTVVENLLARHYVRQMLHPGDRIRLGAVEGTVVRFGVLVLWVEDAEGELRSVPCQLALQAELSRRPMN